MQVARTDAQRLMPPRKSLLPKAKPASRQFLGPRQPERSNIGHGNDPLGITKPVVHGIERAARWSQLNQVAAQAGHTFNPTTKSGLIQDAAMFYGGPGEDTTSLLNREMPGQFERYSPAKSAAGGHLGHDMLPGHVGELMRIAREHPDPAVRLQALKEVHDHFFGGEVHAKGDIPQRPTEAPPNQMREAARPKAQDIYDHMGRGVNHPDFTPETAGKEPRYNAEAHAALRTRKLLESHGISAREPFLQRPGRVAPPGHPLSDPTTETDMGERPPSQHAFDALGLHAQRQAILQRFYQRQAFNHPELGN